VHVARDPLALGDQRVLALRLERDLLALTEDPEHHPAEHDRPEHQEEVGREPLDTEQ